MSQVSSSSFPGCVQSVSLNGAMLDLSKANSKLGVSSCFSKDQAGSYFNGSGYAELSKSKTKWRWFLFNAYNEQCCFLAIVCL